MYHRHRLLFGFAIMLVLHSLSCSEISVTNLFEKIEKECMSDFTLSCVKSRTIEWINFAQNLDEVTIADSLSLIKTGNYSFGKNHGHINALLADQIVDSLDDYISTHSLKVKLPVDRHFKEKRSHIENGNQELLIPLDSKAIVQGRGLVRKALIPFLLGLKFQTSVLVPFALALIALKTWKAMTFGLLSLVLSGAIIVFKLLKQNIINYEVIQPLTAEHSNHHHTDLHLDSLPYHDYDRVNNLDSLKHHLDHHFNDPLETETGRPSPDQPPLQWQPQSWDRR